MQQHSVLSHSRVELQGELSVTDELSLAKSPIIIRWIFSFISGNWKIFFLLFGLLDIKRKGIFFQPEEQLLHSSSTEQKLKHNKLRIP